MKRRGRQKGVTKEVLERRGPNLKRWRPRQWEPIYHTIVILAAQGWSNRMIAAQTHYTEQHVSNILNLPQAEELRKRILTAMEERALADIPAQLSQVAQKVTQRVRTVMFDDKLFEKMPLAVLDRGLRLLEGMGHLKNKNAVPDMVNNFNGPVMMLNQERSDMLFEGLTKANEVKKRHTSVPSMVDGRPSIEDTKSGVPDVGIDLTKLLEEKIEARPGA